jgi:2-keto-3-deoxy-6-phosphogluconate aldolase
MNNKAAVRKRIEEVGIVPVIRAHSPDEAWFAAEAIQHEGISIVEITMTVPGALDVISNLVRTSPELLVGAGTVLNPESARRCLDAGAQFLVSPGLKLETVEFAGDLDVALHRNVVGEDQNQDCEHAQKGECKLKRARENQEAQVEDREDREQDV